MVKPSIGRIVHYNDAQLGTCAAIVTMVRLDDSGLTVDLEVFGVVGVSPRRFPTRVQNDEAGRDIGTWWWPPREGVEPAPDSGKNRGG